MIAPKPFLAAALLVVVAPLIAHSFHASIGELELDSKTKRAELSLRVFTDDLENALSAGEPKAVKLETTSDADARIVAYLDARLVLRDANGKALKWKWVGRESDVQTTWIYVETTWSGAAPKTLENRLFFELFADQVNSVNVRRDGKRSGLAYMRDDGAKPLQ